MRNRISTRILSLFICVFLFLTGVYAQGALGPQRLLRLPAPTLRNRTRLSVGMPRVGRPRIAFVGRVGGVAFDSVAKPAGGLTVNTLQLSYSPSKRDGERLSLTINGQAITAPIYDWQLIPIAKFANSDSYSCFTLFGDLRDSEEQKRILERGGRILNYHQDFDNTLMGLRLFQLDNLIINEYSFDLVKDNNEYILGAGESAPNIEANKKGLQAFRKFEEQNKELFSKGTSYVISDRERQVTFDLQDNKLNLHGEPSYYFWQMDEMALLRLINGEAAKEVGDVLLAQVQRLRQTNPTINPRTWLIQQVLREVANYEQQIGDYRFLMEFDRAEVVALLSTKGATPQSTAAARRALLNRQPLASLLDNLVTLRIFSSVQQATAIPELSEKISNETAMLRAINPAVWDAGVAVMQYGAFFRYSKQKNPVQWNLFMRQIKRAPTPQPPVTTFTVMEAPPQ